MMVGPDILCSWQGSHHHHHHHDDGHHHRRRHPWDWRLVSPQDFIAIDPFQDQQNDWNSGILQPGWDTWNMSCRNHGAGVVVVLFIIHPALLLAPGWIHHPSPSKHNLWFFFTNHGSLQSPLVGSSEHFSCSSVASPTTPRHGGSQETKITCGT